MRRAVPKPRALAVFLIALATIGAWTAATGIKMAPDSVTYAYWADRLLANGFNYPQLIAEAQTAYPPALYVIFAGLVAVLKLGFGEGWAAALVVLNMLAHAGLAVLLVAATSRATGSRIAAWAGLALFLGCHDLVQWAPVASSDTIFFFLSFAAFSLTAVYARPAWGLGLAAAVAFYRPPALILAPTLALGLWLSRASARVRRFALTGLVLLIPAGVLLAAWVLQEPSRWPLEALSSTIQVTADHYRAGFVVYDRPETYHATPHAVLDFAAITADRLVHFFHVSAKGFSAAHTAVQALFFVPVYLLGLVLLAEVVRGKVAVTSAQRTIILSSAVTVGAYALFHALVQVDFDWRYRAPILPHLILLACCGIGCIEARIRGREPRT